MALGVITTVIHTVPLVVDNSLDVRVGTTITSFLVDFERMRLALHQCMTRIDQIFFWSIQRAYGMLVISRTCHVKVAPEIGRLDIAPHGIGIIPVPAIFNAIGKVY